MANLDKPLVLRVRAPWLDLLELGEVRFQMPRGDSELGTLTDWQFIDLSSAGITLTSGSTYTFYFSGGSINNVIYNNSNTDADGPMWFNGATYAFDLPYEMTITAACEESA